MSYTNNWTQVIRQLMEAKKNTAKESGSRAWSTDGFSDDKAIKKRDASGVGDAWGAHLDLSNAIRQAENHLHGTYGDVVDRAASHDDSGKHKEAAKILHATRRKALAHLKKAIAEHEKQHGSLDSDTPKPS